MTKKQEGGWDSEENAVTSNWVKFNVPIEDKVMGTLISVREVKSTIPGQEGKMVKIYELKADEGSFHDADEMKQVIEPAITINAGDYWNVGGKPAIDQQMRNVKIGQKVGFKLIDIQPSKTKGFAPAKNVKVFTPKGADGKPLMDTEFLNEQAVNNFGETE